MPTVFISYSRTDTEFVKRLVAYLKQREVDYWLDLERIQAGADWSDSVWTGLQSCDVMILVISPAAMVSREVAKEWKYHQQMQKPIVPVLVDGTTNIHYQLISLQYVDFQRHPFADACMMLENEINRVAGELENRPARDDGTLQERPHDLPLPPAKTTDLLQPYEGNHDKTTAKIDADLVKQFEERLHHFNERMLLELIHVQDNNLRIEARISPGREYVIGRKSDEIVPDIDLMQLGQGKQGISRRHAALKLDGDTLFIKDLGSTNATFVEGKRLRGSEQLAVKSGDRIQMGNLLLTIHFRDETNTE
jgi:hypothetical protein